MSNFLTVFSRFVFVNVIQLLQFFVIARFYSISDNGTISILVASSFILGQGVMLGLPSSIVYYGSRNSIKSVMRIVFIHCLIVFSLLSLLMIVLSSNDKYVYILLLVVANVIFLISQSFFQLRENFKAQNIIVIMQVLSTFLALLSDIVFFSSSSFYNLIVTFNLISSVIVMFFTIINVSNIRDCNNAKCDYVLFYKYSLATYVNSMLSLINGRLDIVVIGCLLGNHQAGIYSFIVQICERLSIFSQVITTIIFPRFSKESNISIVLSKTYIYVFMTFIFTSIGCFLFLYLIPLCNEYLFDFKYTEALKFIQYGLLAVLLNSTARIIYITFSSIGSVKVNIKIGIIISLITITVFPFSSYFYGVLGAVISLTITALLSLSISMMYLKRIKCNYYGK